jgi:signal-transduction protein with cAMP-binding, CBS, and nucleotidyltransferase domain
MSVGRICSRVVVTASPKESVLTVARRMEGQNVGSVVIVSADGKPLAIVTDRDVAVRCVAHELSARDTSVSAIMTGDLRTVDESVPIEQALRTMASAGTRRLVVTGMEGKLHGVISLDDLMDLIIEEEESIGRVLRQGAPRIVRGD